VFLNILTVITKAGEIRLDESLATLHFVEGATFYSDTSETDNNEKSLTFHITFYYFFEAIPAIRCNLSLRGTKQSFDKIT
jgi:hypothetical protein